MPDYGSKIADKAIDQTAKQLREIYKKAADNLRKKMADFQTRHAAKQKELFARLEKGEITKAEYDTWMRGQVFIGKQWKQKLDQATKIMGDANREAVMLISQNRLNVFAENYNFAAYQLEQQTRGVVSFNLYNDKSVARLLKKKPKMLPEWKIDQPKDYKWNRQKVENSITQGIIQGERIDQITDRLVTNLCTQNESRMRTFARTGMTGAQNAGRQELMKEAEDEGIKVKKRWVATLDSRTRDTHQELDGQEVPVDEPFVVDGMEIMYPGDPSAEPELVYNCRCTMIEVYEGIDRKSVRRDEDDNEVENMTYKEWKQAKENDTLNTAGGQTQQQTNDKKINQKEEQKRDPRSVTVDEVMDKANEMKQSPISDWEGDKENLLQMADEKTIEQVDKLFYEIPQDQRYDIAEETTVELSELFTEQQEVFIDRIEEVAEGFDGKIVSGISTDEHDGMLVVRYNDKMIVMDGNNRANLAILKGQEKIDVMLIDLDEMKKKSRWKRR